MSFPWWIRTINESINDYFGMIQLHWKIWSKNNPNNENLCSIKNARRNLWGITNSRTQTVLKTSFRWFFIIHFFRLSQKWCIISWILNGFQLLEKALLPSGVAEGIEKASGDECPPWNCFQLTSFLIETSWKS